MGDSECHKDMDARECGRRGCLSLCWRLRKRGRGGMAVAIDRNSAWAMRRGGSRREGREGEDEGEGEGWEWLLWWW